jgi:arginine-tRNA-protein transferase
MAQSSAEEFIQFLGNRRFEGTVFFEFRRAGLLVAVSVIDILDDGYSAVYTFFDPVLRSKGLGTFAILWLIEALRERGLDWLYLGFWIPASQKMAYKCLYRPHQVLMEKGWLESRD